MGPLERLFGSLRGCLERFPDKRQGTNGTYTMADIGLSAFSVFFMQSPSFLSHQRRLELGHGGSNCQSLFGISKIPSDNHIRAMLDPAEPSLLEPVFGEVLDELEQADGLARFRRPAAPRASRGEMGHVLIALDGTEYFCSGKEGGMDLSNGGLAKRSGRGKTQPEAEGEPGVHNSHQ